MQQLGVQDRQQIAQQRPTPSLNHCGLPNNKEKFNSKWKEPIQTVAPSVFGRWYYVLITGTSQFLIISRNPNLTLNMPRNASHLRWCLERNKERSEQAQDLHHTPSPVATQLPQGPFKTCGTQVIKPYFMTHKFT